MPTHARLGALVALALFAGCPPAKPTVKRCADVTCAAHQQCQEHDTADATCLEACDDTYYWSPSTRTCTDVAPGCAASDPNSISSDCTAKNRTCETSPAPAHCGGCVSGYADFDAGACELPATCAELSCTTDHRACEELPNGHCTTCLTGFVEELGTCRAPKTCADLDCGSQFCIDSPTADATCSDSCGDHAVLGSDNICHACPVCGDAAAGEDGPWLAGATGENRCICRTLPGFFWREGNNPGVVACDADGDGWVRESAKIAIDSTNVAVSTNARCDVRKVATVRLENERGDLKDVPVSPVWSLYETDRNDDAQLLQQAMTLGTPRFPATMGAGGRAITNAELNSLTKYCEDGQTDFNENGLADVNEWQGNTSLGAVKSTFQPFIDFVYFGELYDGWYEPPNTTGQPGWWHIKERSRQTEMGMVLPADAGSFWQQCDRLVDADFARYPSRTANNLDFARFGTHDGGFLGMNQESQFKCLRVVSSHQAGDLPNWLTPGEIAAQNYQVNTCAATAAPVPPRASVDPVNPSSLPTTCSLVDPSSLTTNGQVVWAIATYQPYLATGDYQRGCVNECLEYATRCPGYDPTLFVNPSSCFGDATNSGQLQCTCDYRFSGAACDFSCTGSPATAAVAPSNLFLDPNFQISDGGLMPAREGYWMCAAPTVTAADPLNWYLTDSEYSLSGEMPWFRVSVDALVEDVDGGAGYAIH